MNIYLYEDYKAYLKDYVEEQQKQQRGFVGKISRALNIHTSHVSAVINGEKDFTLEQFYSLAKFLDLDSEELEYLMLLAQYSRSGTYDYRQYVKDKILVSQKNGLKKQKAFSGTTELSTEEKNVFYSSWLYPAVQLYCSTGDGKTMDEIQNKFQLEKEKLIEILQFLTEANLCRHKANIYSMSDIKTFVNSSSPLWAQHHKNWRLKSIQRSEYPISNEVLYTSLVSLSVKDFNSIREDIFQLMKTFSKKVKESPSEDLACLNIDWFLVK